MILFYSQDIEGDIIRLDEEESGHCVRVLRHKPGDEIKVADGRGNLYTASLLDASPKAALATVISRQSGWGVHPYHLTMAVCPTKNNDRYEWFAEKATELGVDVIVPVIGDHSERKVFKTDRLRRILLSAAKQSLKCIRPEVAEPLSVKDFILEAPQDALRLIAYCDESMGERISIRQELEKTGGKPVIVLIGPEGDFSREEVEMAFAHGFKAVHLGASRLRTETAALTAVEAMYFVCM